jgi:hypothetical protein
MKVEKVKAEVAKEEFDKIAVRHIGQWTEITNEVTKKGTAARITGITNGQVAALKRKCKELNLPCKSIDKGTGVIILPPVKKA